MEIILLLSGIVIGGVISWVIAHAYYKKALKDQKEANEKLSKELQEINTLKYFEILLEQSNWEKESIGNDEVWISQTNNTFQIHCSISDSLFSEPWTIRYPDKHARQCPVCLKIGNTTIKEITFISLDGGRIFVPLTERDFINDKSVFYWDMKSLRVKVCQVIGYYYIYDNLQGVAARSGVEIRE